MYQIVHILTRNFSMLWARCINLLLRDVVQNLLFRDILHAYDAKQTVYAWQLTRLLRTYVLRVHPIMTIKGGPYSRQCNEA
jgi:hypothetical protein